MKKLFFVLLLVPQFAFAEEITIQVKGMVCSFCAQGIKKTLLKEAGVVDVRPDLESKLVSLTLQEGASISDQKLSGVIHDAGYEVEKIERKK